MVQGYSIDNPPLAISKGAEEFWSVWVYLLKKWAVISKGLRVVYSQPTLGALGYLVEMVGLFWVGYCVRELGWASEEKMNVC
jgi:hypothetical protein